MAPSRPKPARGTKSQDVKFVSDIGENLLLECRMLHKKLTSSQQAIRTLESDQEQLRAQNQSLEARLASIGESEERYKEENWNLELKLQELKDQVSKSTVAINKAATETGRLQSDKSSQIEIIETLRLREAELKHEIETLKSKHESDISGFKREQELLQTENSSLQHTITDLKHEIETKPAIPLMTPMQRTMPAVDSDKFIDDYDDFDFETSSNSPPGSPVKSTPSRNSVLETETVKASLGHAHRMISNLRSSLHREKNEKVELKRLLNETQEELEQARSGSRSKKLKIPAPTHRMKTTFPAISKKNTRTGASKTFLDNTITNKDEDESVEDVDAFTSPETRHTSSEDESDDIKTTLKSSAFRMARGTKAQRENSASEDDEFEQKLRALSDSESNLSSSGGFSQEGSPLKNKSLASEFLSVDDLERHAEQHGLVTVPVDEYDELVKNQSGKSQTVEEITNAATELGMLLYFFFTL